MDVGLIRVEVFDDSDGRVRVRVAGELDLASRSVFESKVLRLISETQAHSVVIDLAELSFCDASGLNAFAAAHRQAAARNKTLVLANATSTVALLFDTVQFGRVVPIHSADGSSDAPGQSDTSEMS
jgi:anti-anti-sigma factor